MGLIALSIILLASISSAEVSLQNTYATSGSETRESIYLRGVDYTNTASIYQTTYSASSAASSACWSARSVTTSVTTSAIGTPPRSLGTSPRRQYRGT